jgi:hypothetical protein
VHFRAQIGRNCTLFASESAKKGVFCRGGGATFWQAKNGGFWGLARSARDTSRARENGVPSPFPSTDLFINQKYFYFACATKTFRLVAMRWIGISAGGMLRMHPDPTMMVLLIVVRSLPKCRRLR